MKKVVSAVLFVAIALAITSASSATVRGLLTGRDIKDGSLTSADIANKTLEIKNISGAAVAALSGQVGPAGATGPAGAVGAQGPAGPTGAKGDRGATGAQGVVGATGAQGLPGLQGGIGPQGPAGADGAIGPTGEIGPQGVVGATGAQGPPGLQGGIGPQGPAGADGATGATGATGAKGDTGDRGATGPQGPKGDTGAAGATGPNGDPGAAGATGAKGDPGATGATGAKGDPGADGVSSVLAASLGSPMQIDETGENAVNLALPAAKYLLMAKLNFVSGAGAVATCTLDPGDGTAGDSLVIKLGAGFDTSNSMMIPINYAAPSTAALHCSADAGNTFTITSARIVAVETQSLTVTP